MIHALSQRLHAKSGAMLLSIENRLERIMQMNQNVHGAPAQMVMAPNLSELRGTT